MSREYVYFLSHPPIGSLCRLGSLCSLPSILASDIYGLIQQEKSPQKKRSCSPSQHRTLRPFPYISAIRHIQQCTRLLLMGMSVGREFETRHPFIVFMFYAFIFVCDTYQVRTYNKGQHPNKKKKKTRHMYTAVYTACC